MKPSVDALLDSNVLVALVAEAHERHPASAALFADQPRQGFAVAAHSYAEVYHTLTRRGPRAAFAWAPRDAWATLESVRALTTLLGLSPAQMIGTVRNYAASGGIGARLYDRLIGEVAVRNRIPRIVTWNLGHMRDLFPELEVLDPEAALRSATG